MVLDGNLTKKLFTNTDAESLISYINKALEEGEDLYTTPYNFVIRFSTQNRTCLKSFIKRPVIKYEVIF